MHATKKNLNIKWKFKLKVKQLKNYVHTQVVKLIKNFL